ncbi:helix-turn-helix domain-containing protein [Klebsiella pneumoniae]|uniref:helix-turn-helix domain-containing protein n=1 Tax=Klebsiella pneumoniae TaxID=573 RepID=UPI0028DF1373|nr:helix-turn-helix domain-containing protein [Klebsiella pneumoniae]MDT8783215.1 helix-turn-helix domain-containing protein [Klebsiella pneumoniae]
MNQFVTPVKFFSMCPASISSAPHVNGVALSPSDKLVFGYLYSFCVTTGSWKVYPPIPLIAVSMGVNEKTVRRSVDALERSGLLSVERKRGAGNVYTVNPQLLNTLERALNERLEAHRQEAKEKKEQRLYGEHKAEAEQWEQVTHIVTLPDFKAEEIEW